MRHDKSIAVRTRLYRYPLGLVCVLVVLTGVVVYIVVPSLWKEAQSWGAIVNAPSESEIASIIYEINYLTEQSVKLQDDLERALSQRRFRASDRQTLGFIRWIADSLGLELKSIDSKQPRDQAEENGRTLTLRAEGKYDQFGSFISEVEMSEYGLIVRQLTLARLNPRNSRLSGTIVLTTPGKALQPQ